MGEDAEDYLREEVEDLRRMADIYRRTSEIYAAERDHARALYARTMDVLMGIHSLLNPPLVTDRQGRTFQFRSPVAHEQLQELSNRIRAIPEEIAAVQNGAGHFKK